MATVVQELVARLGLEFDEGPFKKALAAVDSLKAGMFAIGAGVAAAGAALVAATVHTARLGDEMGDLADRLGLNVEELQKLRHAANLSDVDFGQLTQGFKFLTKNMAAAAEGSKEAQQALGNINLKKADGSLRAVDEVMIELSDRFASMKSETAQNALAMKIFGRGGEMLVPMLKKGSAGINALKKEAESLGIVLSEETVAAASEFDSSNKRLSASLAGVVNTIGGPLIPLLTDFVKEVTRLAVEARPWIKQNMPKVVKLLTESLKLATEALGFFVEHITEFKVLAILTIGTLIGWKLALLGLLGPINLVGTASVAAAAKSLGAWLSFMAPFAAAALAIGALGLIIFLIYDDLITTLEGGDSALNDLIKSFNTLADDVENGPLLRVFGILGSLLFDITDTRRWAQLGDVIVDTFVGALTFVENKLNGLLTQFPFLQSLVSGYFGVAKAVGGSVVGAAASAPGNAMSYLTSPATLGSAATTNSTTNSNKNMVVNINASGLSPNQVIEVVKNYSEEVNQSTYSAVSQ